MNLNDKQIEKINILNNESKSVKFADKLVNLGF